MTLWIDRLLNLCKWPIAFVMLVNTPMLIKKMGTILMLCWSVRPDFFIGMFGYIVFWRFILSRRLFGSWIPTLVHESIHAFFAILTGHRIVDFKVRWNGGGHMSYAGGVGNWVISISPYFVPFTTLVVFTLEQIWPLGAAWRTLSIGLLFGFEIVYVWRQVHWQQTDLQEVGWLFVGAFLPGALLLSYLMTLTLVLFEANELVVILNEMTTNTKTSTIFLLQKIESLGSN